MVRKRMIRSCVNCESETQKSNKNYRELSVLKKFDANINSCCCDNTIMITTTTILACKEEMLNFADKNSLSEVIGYAPSSDEKTSFDGWPYGKARRLRCFWRIMRPWTFKSSIYVCCHVSKNCSTSIMKKLKSFLETFHMVQMTLINWHFSISFFCSFLLKDLVSKNLSPQIFNMWDQKNLPYYQNPRRISQELVFALFSQQFNLKLVSVITFRKLWTTLITLSLFLFQLLNCKSIQKWKLIFWDKHCQVKHN